MIVLLGGTVDSEKYTIPLTNKMRYRKSCMMALARGCTILHISYISKSSHHGSFIDFKKFEFGNQKYTAALVFENPITMGSFKRRQWIHFEHSDRFVNGAFTGKRQRSEMPKSSQPVEGE
jgi:hypothetical protein